MPAADLIVLPGSKAVRADLDWLRAQGWEAAIKGRNFEKVRWASANSDLEFHEWLLENGHSDLVQT